MSRLFDDGSSEYLERDQAVIGTPPFAMVCLFNTNDMDVTQILMSITDKDVDNQFFILQLSDVTNTILAGTQDALGGYWAYSTSNYSAGIWQHACGIWAATDDRRALLEGVNKGIETSFAAPLNLDRTSIGRLGRATPNEYMSGMIAEAAIYDLSQWPGATDSDKADNFEKILPSLAKGFSPLFFPLGLKAYWPLIREANI